MSHLPVDHSLRGAYRGLAGLTGAAAVGYGVVALVQTSGHPFFDHTGESVLGMKANPAAAVLWLVVGVLALVTALIGRNVDVRVNLILGPLLFVVGTVELCLIRTSANVLASSITTVCTVYVVGLILLAASLYTGTVSGTVTRRPVVDRPTDAREPAGAAR